MKFTVFSNDLQKALSKIISVVPSKSTLPILENILFELSGNTLKMTATDMEMYMGVELAVSGGQDGRIAIPARRLNETVRALPNLDLHVAIDQSLNKISMRTEQGEYKMSGEAADNFPVESRIKGQLALEIDAAILKGIIHKSTFAVSNDELRPAMTGMLLQWQGEEMRAVATDGHRLVKVIQTGLPSAKNPCEVIIPAKALGLLAKLLETGTATVTFAETNVMFEVNEFQLISRIIDERYPNYESVIPVDNDKVLTVNRLALLAAVRRCALYSNTITNQIRYHLADGELRVSAEDIDFGGEAKELIPCTFSAEPMEIGFNARYVEDALTHVDSENIEFEFSSPTRAGVIKPLPQADNQNVILLVMPVRLNV